MKWPNDLVTPHGKIGGILTEAEGEWIVIGCGVNLWWDDAPDGIAAACADDPGPDLGVAVGRHWAATVLEVGEGEPDRWGVEAFREACVTLNSMITWEPGGTGVARDVDVSGGLVVDTPHGRRVLTSGEVHTVRTATVAADRPSDEGGGAA